MPIGVGREKNINLVLLPVFYQVSGKTAGAGHCMWANEWEMGVVSKWANYIVVFVESTICICI